MSPFALAASAIPLCLLYYLCPGRFQWMLLLCVSLLLYAQGGLQPLAFLVCTALVVWGAADFEGLFVLFHRLSFDNGLWLLNPQTDLLIRLMPTSFFVSYAAILGGTWLGALLVMAAVAWRLKRLWKTNEVKP